MARSLTSLARRLDEVVCLVGVCKSRRQRGARRISEEAPALLRGALVLLSSHLEGFFEELVEDIVEGIDSGIQSVGEMPKAIRVRQVLGGNGRWETNDVNKRWDLVRTAASSHLLDDNATYSAGMLDTGLHIGGFSNPGTSEIAALFKSVGIENFWTSFHSIEPRVSYKNEIDAIVSRRNQIAHGDINSGVTQLDIESYIRNFRYTAEVAGRVAEEHVRSIVPGFHW